MRLPCIHTFKPYETQKLVKPRCDLDTRHAGAPHAVGDVVGHRHVRKQSVILEHDVDRPRCRRHVGHVDAVDFDAAAVDTFESGQHAKKRGLAATRCTEKAEQFGPVDVERQIVDRQHVAEPARYILDSNNG